MSESEFWKCTFRELKALVDMHIELNTPKKGPRKGYIDEVI